MPLSHERARSRPTVSQLLLSSLTPVPAFSFTKLCPSAPSARVPARSLGRRAYGTRARLLLTARHQARIKAHRQATAQAPAAPQPSASPAPTPAGAAKVSKAKRILLDYDSTINPGQGNAPLTAERAEMLDGFLTRWKKGNPQLDIFVLTASNPDKKKEGLRAAKLAHHFSQV